MKDRMVIFCHEEGLKFIEKIIENYSFEKSIRMFPAKKECYIHLELPEEPEKVKAIDAEGNEKYFNRDELLKYFQDLPCVTLALIDKPRQILIG